MALATAVASSQTLEGSLTGSDIETRFNAALAGLLTNNIISLHLNVDDQPRRQGKSIDVQVGYDDAAGEKTLTSPYQLRTFVGTTLEEALDAATAFRAANPTYFFVAPFHDHIVPFASANKPYVVFQIYSQDGTNGPFNWWADGSITSGDFVTGSSNLITTRAVPVSDGAGGVLQSGVQISAGDNITGVNSLTMGLNLSVGNNAVVSGSLVVGVDPGGAENVRIGGTIQTAGMYIAEQAVAGGSSAGKGQIWVRNDTPSVLMYTDDAGTDFLIGSAGTVLPAGTVTNSTLRWGGASWQEETDFLITTGGYALAPNGAVGAPSITFSADPDTGFYRVGANQLGITIGGTLRGTWSSSGLTIAGGLFHTDTQTFDYHGTDPFTGVVLQADGFDGSGLLAWPIISLDSVTSGGAGTIKIGSTTTNYVMLSADTSWQLQVDNADVLAGNATVITASKPISALAGLFVAGNITIDSSGVILNEEGTAAAPSYSFDGDTNTGIYRAGVDSVGISCGGSNVGTWSTSGLSVAGDFDFSGVLLAADGTGAAPSYTFSADTNTGIYRSGADQLGISCGGGQVGSWSSSGLNVLSSVTANGFKCAGSGTAGFPCYSFSGDTNTGFYRVGADQLGISCGGTLRGTWSSSSLTSTVPIIVPDGSAAAPAYSFTSDTNTGLYRSGIDSVGISCGGTNVLDISSTNVGITATYLTCTTAAILGTGGSAGSPFYTFLTDPNTGIYSVVADQLGISCGGTLRGTWSSSALTLAGSVSLIGGASGSPFSIEQSVQDSYTWLKGGTTGGVDASIQVFGSTHASLANYIRYNGTKHEFRNATAGTLFAEITSAGLSASGSPYPLTAAASADAATYVYVDVSAYNRNAGLQLRNSTGNWIIQVPGGGDLLDVYSVTAAQTIARFSSAGLNLVTAGDAYLINSTQVVGARRTGWTNQTAVASRADLGAAPTVGALASFCRALYDDLKAHGLIGN